MAVLAGCTTIEHGALADRAVMQLMVERGTWFDPNIFLVSDNYLANKERFLGIGSYTEEGMRVTAEAIPIKLKMFKEALTVPGLKILFGTDGVRGTAGTYPLDPPTVRRVGAALVRALPKGIRKSSGTSGPLLWICR